MKPRRICAVFLCFSLFFIAACGKKTALKKPLCRVVTGVEIYFQEKNVTFTRSYRDEEKMQKFLIYLRTLNPHIRPLTLPQTPTVNRCRICLHFSDGKEKNYYQIDHKYISDNYKFCHAIEPDKAWQLYRLIQQMPDDRL